MAAPCLPPTCHPSEQTPRKKKNKVCKIADLSISNLENWPICGKVVKVRPTGPPQKVQQYFKCWVKDETGTIEVLAYDQDAKYFEGKLILDQVVFIRNGQVKPSNDYYGDNFHEYEIVLKSYLSTVVPHLDVQEAEFYPLHLITETALGEDTVDVIGVVEHVDPVEIQATFYSDTTPLRKIVISDGRGVSVPLAFWNKQADALDVEVNLKYAFKRVKVKRFKGDIQLQSCMFTTVEVIPDQPEAKPLRKRGQQSDSDDDDDDDVQCRRGRAMVSKRRLFNGDSSDEESSSPSGNHRYDEADEDRINKSTEEKDADDKVDNDEDEVIVGTRKNYRRITSDDEDGSDEETPSFNSEQDLHDLDLDPGSDSDSGSGTAKRTRLNRDDDSEHDEPNKRSFKRIKQVDSSLETEATDFESDSASDTEGSEGSCSSSGSTRDSDDGSVVDSQESESEDGSVMDSQESLRDAFWEEEGRELSKDPLFVKVNQYLYWMTMKADGETVDNPFILAAVNRLEGDIQVKQGVCSSMAWCEKFRNAVKKYPKYKSVKERDSNCFGFADLVDCEACNRSNRPWSYKVTFGGRPYNRNTYEEVDNDEESDAEEASDFLFMVGRFCHQRSRLYSKLYHWSFHLFQKCRRKLAQFDNEPKRADIVSRDRDFLKEVYGNLKGLMETTLQEYTEDGSWKKRFKQHEVNQSHIS